MADPYLYADTPVLKNKLDIRDEKVLDLVEAEQSRANMMLLYERGFSDFTPAGLCEIHRFLFGDIYDWAGEYRIINIEKRENCWLAEAYGTAMMRISPGIWRTHSKNFCRRTGRSSPDRSLSAT